MRIVLIFVVSIALAACQSSLTTKKQSERAVDDLTLFFTSGAHFGMSSDAGLYKKGSRPGGEWDHIATIHGMRTTWICVTP
jgi:hypothetical protein